MTKCTSREIIHMRHHGSTVGFILYAISSDNEEYA